VYLLANLARAQNNVQTNVQAFCLRRLTLM